MADESRNQFARRRAAEQAVLDLPRKFVVTTDSNHHLRVYPSLAGQMEVSGISQLWRSDITYLRLEKEFYWQ